MPFGRRKPLRWRHRLHDLVWPRIGLRRAMRVYWHRLQRLPGTPASIAAGFGWGVGFSVSPLIGTHMVLAALCARLSGASMLAALLGSLAVNPWTAPPVWMATYYTGRFLEGAGTEARAPGFINMFRGLTEAVLTLDVDMFVNSVWPVLKPMIVGSIPLGIAAGVLSYCILRPALTRAAGAPRRSAFISVAPSAAKTAPGAVRH